MTTHLLELLSDASIEMIHGGKDSGRCKPVRKPCRPKQPRCGTSKPGGGCGYPEFEYEENESCD
jgi:hypothetical protein